MGFFDKLFGKKKEAPSAPAQVPPAKTEQPEAPQATGDPATNPNLLKVYDEYGRETYVTKQQWRDDVLLKNLETYRDNPDALASMLVDALRDGFAADIVSYAEHLHEIDPVPVRGTTLLANVYMELGRLDDAESILEAYLAEHGEQGLVLTNLARVFSLRKEEDRALTLLWHGLELDPNQENGLVWYAAIQRQRHGAVAELEAYRMVAKLPNSWRARVFMARDAVQKNDLATAEALYQEALSIAGEPAPWDLLMQMSGDLGNSGHLGEILRLVAPHYHAEAHGVQVGNNLIKANVELGRLDEARRLLQQLSDQQRPDWKANLDFWESELAKAETVSKAAEEPGKPVALAMVSIEGPLWMREGAPFASLMPPKREGAQRVAIFGSTALVGNGAEKPTLQLADSVGRLSRSVPLMLAELIHLTTEAVGVALIPWAQGKGFALFGSAYSDKAICEMAGKGEDAPEYVLGVTVDATQPVWKIDLRLIRGVLGTRVAESSIEIKLEDQGALIENLSKLVDNMLTTETGINLANPPQWYQLPGGYGGADYLLRLEQQLTLACNNLEFLQGGGLFAEREILDGAMQLCANQPRNPTVRMLFAQTLRMMKKARPDILPEYKEKTAHLQRSFPISEEVGVLVDKAIGEAFANS